MLRLRGAAFFAASLALACGPSKAGAPAHEPEPHAHSCGSAHHRFEDADRWAKVFDDPKRDAWQRPDEVVAELGLSEDSRVADLGAGTGYFVMRLARKLPRGRVFAVDIEPSMVEHTKHRAHAAGLDNVEGIVAKPDDPGLPSGVNLVLVVDTYHHIENRSAYFQRLRPRLAPGGRVVIVDFKQGDLPVGPPNQHKIPPEVVAREMQAAGYRQCRSWDGLPYQYVLYFAESC